MSDISDRDAVADVKKQLIRAVIHATEAAGLMNQSRFLAAIDMPETWIEAAILRPETVPLDQYVKVYDLAADQAGWHPLHAIIREVTDRQRFSEWP